MPVAIPTIHRALVALGAILGSYAMLALPARAAPPDLVEPGKLSYGVAATFAPFEFTATASSPASTWSWAPPWPQS